MPIVANVSDCVVSRPPLEARIAGPKHHALRAAVSGHELEGRCQKRPVVFACPWIEQVNASDVALAALRRSEPAETADRDRAHEQPVPRKLCHHQIEPGTMAADDDQIRHAHMRREQRDLGLRASRHLVGQRVDLQEAVGL